MFLLVLGDLDVAFFADPDWKLVASQRKRTSLRRAAVTDGLAATPSDQS